MKNFASRRSCRSTIASSSALPPIVSFARTSTLAMRLRLRLSRGTAGRGRDLLLRLDRSEDPVHRARDAVLVGTADHGRHPVEVEEGWRRGDLPLQGEGAPRVGGGERAAASA